MPLPCFLDGSRCGLKLCLLLAAVAVSGCGAKKAEVVGTVTYNGKTLGSGSVTFIGKDSGGKEVRETATIQGNGSYKIARAPVGAVTITVETIPSASNPGISGMKGAKDMPSIQMPGGAAGEAGPYVKIPDKYKDPSSSGLTYTVKPGKQKHDIDLE